MGECACGDINVKEGYRVGDNVLAVEIYPGCDSCDTGAQVTLHLFTPTEAAEHDIEVKGDFKPDEHGWARLAFPLLSADDLIEAARQLDDESSGMFEHHGSLSEMLKDKWRRLLQRGLRIVRQKVDSS